MVGPFRVDKAVGPGASRLDLPANMRIHKVFHVLLLKPYRSVGKVQPPALPAELEDGSGWFQVEWVCMHREKTTGKKQKSVLESLDQMARLRGQAQQLGA